MNQNHDKQIQNTGHKVWKTSTFQGRVSRVS
ncbi:predicted protein [Aspergillus nidulans FGSC A4]|uniref:Uncharacterized protein n=1 Tax=Emericella nidulans (strain FGSC A4 / ATCC 38163 / CBS 112.46 / NRRL 194 / M139) TaxID=227321 RepID=Q5B0B9_EMENI|nr:hypothetical protein [Aspergillus nidulans FGSC A4]EAA57652.1 predicted protein [Aspergillus nidulans FGSC A4]CBF70368.1 TPA: hypothetical protein ANIA_06011 [Aspergillus nidulans FGSC A4]|eukprot:XP_663615.1 predicted protein [Aspergillus nidulans FGSC A4]